MSSVVQLPIPAKRKLMALMMSADTIESSRRERHMAQDIILEEVRSGNLDPDFIMWFKIALGNPEDLMSAASSHCRDAISTKQTAIWPLVKRISASIGLDHGANEVSLLADLAARMRDRFGYAETYRAIYGCHILRSLEDFSDQFETLYMDQIDFLIAYCMQSVGFTEKEMVSVMSDFLIPRDRLETIATVATLVKDKDMVITSGSIVSESIAKDEPVANEALTAIASASLLHDAILAIDNEFPFDSQKRANIQWITDESRYLCFVPEKEALNMGAPSI